MVVTTILIIKNHYKCKRLITFAIIEMCLGLTEMRYMYPYFVDRARCACIGVERAAHTEKNNIITINEPKHLRRWFAFGTRTLYTDVLNGIFLHGVRGNFAVACWCLESHGWSVQFWCWDDIQSRKINVCACGRACALLMQRVGRATARDRTL